MFVCIHFKLIYLYDFYVVEVKPKLTVLSQTKRWFVLDL